MESSRRTNIYFICFIIFVVECHSILPKGTREVVDTTKDLHIGDSVRLECSTKFSHSRRWSHIPDGNKHRIKISTGDQFVSQEYAGNERFRLDTSTGKYDLLINDLNKQDAGVYFCTTQEKEYSTRLVIEKKQRHLKETPTSVAAIKGQDVRLNCATSHHHPVYWTHIPFGKAVAVDVYVVGMISGSYATSGRYNVEVNASSGQYDLVIRQVQLEDAGTFICIDDYGAGLQVSANVTVLDGSPVCQSNASDDGVLIENDCGLPPDLLHITCRTTFAGSAEPQLLLKHSGVTYEAIAKETTRSDPNGHLVTLITRYILQPDFRMKTEEFSCELIGLHRGPSAIACDVNKFKIQYIFNSTTISRIQVLSPHIYEDSFTCSSNSSEQCSYKWFEFQNPEEFLSFSDSASFGPGKYVCIAECNIRGTICIFASLPFDGVQKLDPVDHGGNLNYTSLMILSSVFLFFLGAFVLLFKKRSWVLYIMKSWSKKNRQELRTLIQKDDTNNRQIYAKQMYTITGRIQMDTADEPVPIRNDCFLSMFPTTDSLFGNKIVKTKSGQGRDEVRGLAIIGGIIYVVRQHEKNIQAYDIASELFNRDIVVPTLTTVRDMASCEHCKCLYVADEDNNTIHKIHLRSSEQNEDMTTPWLAPGVPESLYSKDCHLIVSLHKLKQILILDKNGKEVRMIQLQQPPWHAIPVMDVMYVFSYTSSTSAVDEGKVTSSESAETKDKVASSTSAEKENEVTSSIPAEKEENVTSLTSAEREDKVCLIDKHGNIQGTFEENVNIRLNRPGRMAATKSGLVFIADYHNDRIVLLNSILKPIKENIISVPKPCRICFDEGRQLLFIASDNETHDVFVHQIGYYNRYK